MRGLDESIITVIVTVDCHATIQQQRLIWSVLMYMLYLMKICPFYFIYNIEIMGIVYGNNGYSA